ncbi:MAG TPA: hypothetical protein VGO78_00065 [Acidimicrobiales bacterium]|nr:hypothetical protein [Acidimicrobiales bacterium]
MATQDDVRRIALGLPDVTEAGDRFAFSVRAGARDKGLAWVWQERTEPGRPRIPNPAVLALRVANAGEKEMLLASDPEAGTFFTEPHYNGFPAVLVRLAAIDVDELEELLIDAWRCQAPKKLVKEYEAGEG